MVRGKCGRAARAWRELRCAPVRPGSIASLGRSTASCCGQMRRRATRSERMRHTGPGNRAKFVSWLLRRRKDGSLDAEGWRAASR